MTYLFLILDRIKELCRKKGVLLYVAYTQNQGATKCLDPIYESDQVKAPRRVDLICLPVLCIAGVVLADEAATRTRVPACSDVCATRSSAS